MSETSGDDSLKSSLSLDEIDWVVSASPHLRKGDTTAHIMWTVSATLVPALAWGVYVFGWAALYVVALCVATCLATEYLCNRLRRRPSTLLDGSAVVTGLLMAFILPSHSVVVASTASGSSTLLTLLDWKVPVFGSFFAIAIVKQAFGGLGHNIWNPALAGRAFVQLSFSASMVPPEWPWPPATDGVTSATALSAGSPGFTVKELFFGVCPGCIGEVSAFLLLAGAVVLVARKIIDWRLPIAYMVSLVVVATLCAWSAREPSAAPAWVNEFARLFEGLRAGDVGLAAFGEGWLGFAARQLFAGGLMLGALYMATDMVTSPLTPRGPVYFGIGCGVLTALIRSFAGMPEGVCYAILLMNTARPYVDRISRQRILGERKEKSGD